MMDDCDFSNASDIPTIVNYMMDFCKTTDSVGVYAVKVFTNRNVLSISSCCSKEISRQRNYDDSMRIHSIYGGLDRTDQSFSSECDELEVEEISVLSSLESEM